MELTVTNAAGCSATETQDLSIAAPFVDILVTAGTPEACNQPMTETFASGQMANLTSWTWVFGDGATSGAVSPTHTFMVPGSYLTTLNWTDKNGCTGSSNTLYTTVSAPLNYDFTASSSTTICAGQAVSFTGPTPFNQSEIWTSWFFGDGSESFSFNGAAHIYPVPGVYSVTLNVENVGCSASVVKTDYITVLPSPTISFSAATTCDSPRAAETFTVTAGNGATGIAWQFGDGATVNTGPAITTLEHSYSTDGFYTVNATATNGTCTTTSTVGALIELKPINFYLGVNATSICPAVMLSDTLHQVVPPGSTTDGHEFSYVQWYYADGTPFIGAQNWVDWGFSAPDYYTSELSQFQPGESGLYAIVTNSTGCKDTSNTVPLSIGGTTAAFTIIQDDQCYQQPVLLQDASLSPPGQPITSWQWNFGDGTTSTQAGTVSHLYASPGDYTVTLTVTDALQCTSGSNPVVTGTVTVNGPQAAFTSEGGNVLALGSTATLINTSNVYGATGVVYSWNFGDGGTSTQPGGVTHLYATAGTYTVTLTAQGAGGCVSTATQQIVVQPFNSAFQMGSTYVSAGSCPPVTVQFTNTSYNYTSLLWNFGDGETVANVADPSHVYAQPGTYYVTLTVVNGAGETLVTEDSVIVQEPSVVLGAPATGAVCVGQADTLYATGGKQVGGYVWDFGDGVVNLGDSTATHVYAVAGTYTAHVVVTDALGCAASAASSVTVDVQAPPVAWVTPPSAAICLNGQVTLTANGGATYSWSPATGLSSTTISTPVAAPAVSTVYTVTVADAIGCMSTQNITVGVVQPTTISVTPDSVAICPGKTVAFVASGAQRYAWIGAGLSATDIADPVARPGDSTVVYQVIGGDTLGCYADTVVVTVDVLPQPAVSAGPDETVQAGTPVTLMGVASGDVVSWLWTPATYLSCTDCAQPVCTPKEPEQYIVTVTGGDGCAVSDTVVVGLLCDESKVRIPDAFTPNGDGHNDRWNILGISEVNHLVIFNRWGEKVFERDHFYPADVGAGWDGTVDGRAAPAGVYVYYAEMVCPTGGAFERRGTVILIR